MIRLSVAALALCLVSPSVPSISASAPEQSSPSSRTQNDDWCRDGSWGDRDRESFCEVRKMTIAAPETLHATTSNGSLVITGASRRDVSIEARITAQADTEADAKRLAQDVRISTEGGRIEADGPRTGRHESWWVSYRIETPSRQNIDASTSNGSVNASGLTGRMEFDTSNGSMNLSDLAGDVRATTSNGSLNLKLAGTAWSGTGLEARTSNGSLRAYIPTDYNAHLIASTGNGSLNIDRPITVRGRIGRSIDTDLGKGGPTIRLSTANGSLSVRDR